MSPRPKASNILVVEDNDGDVFLIKKALRDYDIPATVTVCADGESALRQVDPETGSPPDAIILDLAIPRIEGIEVLKAILNRPRLCSARS